VDGDKHELGVPVTANGAVEVEPISVTSAAGMKRKTSGDEEEEDVEEAGDAKRVKADA